MTDTDQTRRPSLSALSAAGWLFVVTLACGLVLVGALAYRLITPEPETPVVTEQLVETSTVVTAVQDLARLETARMHMERVVDLRQRQEVAFGLLTAQDAILLVAAADVSAGVDLERLSDGDIVVYPDRNGVLITLPPVEIFEARLDNDRTYVHSRDTDSLAERSAHLETRARREAESRLREAAVDAGILIRAERNAVTTVTALLRGLGFEDIEVETRDSDVEVPPLD